MNKSFLNANKPMLTVMLQCSKPEAVIGRIRNARCLGADAFGLQLQRIRSQNFRNGLTVGFKQ